jgi:hypothetical protein
MLYNYVHSRDSASARFARQPRLVAAILPSLPVLATFPCFTPVLLFSL